MKHFKTISIFFMCAIAVIFALNVTYLVLLYMSIREDTERNVLNAMADTDVDMLWERAGRQSTNESPMTDPANANMEYVSSSPAIYCEIGKDIYIDTPANSSAARASVAFPNQVSGKMSVMMHMLMDEDLGYDASLTDSIMRANLASRGISPQVVAVDVVNAGDSLIFANPAMPALRRGIEEFRFCYDSVSGLNYRIRLSSLTGHVLSEMSGVIVTTALLMLVFAAAFIYLYRTVTRLRTLEEMKDDFVSNMTHELKTPIAIAYAANDALLHYDMARDASRRDSYLQASLRQLQRLTEMVESILSVSMERRKTMKLKMESVPLRPLLEEAAAAQSLRKDKKIGIRVECDGNPAVMADRQHLSNVVNNLIDNAIKYSGDSVEIVVKGGADGFSVKDNGCGIPARCLPYLFNRFYRVPQGDTASVRGYGIGLYYVKGIIDRLGWKIQVTSRVGKGSEFIITIPEEKS